jgi:hypothetical protein
MTFDKSYRSGLHVGDKVHMVDCSEAEDYGHIEFIVVSEPWLLGHGVEVVKIHSGEKSIRGGFSTKCLRKVNDG